MFSVFANHIILTHGLSELVEQFNCENTGWVFVLSETVEQFLSSFVSV